MRSVLALCACLATLCGCQVRREFVITSQPPGAEVRLDGEIVGSTPLRVPFDHYGTRRVAAYLDGYLTQSRVLDVDPPWYDRFPLDIVSEVLLPIGWRDRRRVHFDLVAGSGRIPPPDLASVLERAESLRRAGPEGPRPVEPKPSANGPDGEPPRPER